MIIGGVKIKKCLVCDGIGIDQSFIRYFMYGVHQCDFCDGKGVVEDDKQFPQNVEVYANSKIRIDADGGVYWK